MTSPTNQALVDALLQLGRPETPDQLARRGVKRVRSVRLSHVSRLIEQALNRSILERTFETSPAEQALALEGARAHFHELLSARHELESSRASVSRELADLEAQLDVLRDRPERDDAPAEHRLEQLAEHARRDALVRESFAEIFAALERDLTPEARAALERVRAQATAVCLAMVQEERRVALAAEIAAHDRQVDVFERRIAKLVASLQAAEKALAAVRALKPVDDGIASIYRVVQGLEVDDTNAERKRALMAEIFQANVELRRKVDGQAGAPTAEHAPAAPLPRRAADPSPA